MTHTPKIVIVGCGVVGAMIAYELSGQVSADISVIDKQLPAQGATEAALGVLMGVISSKVKGRTWRLRETSIRRYPALISELLAQGYSVPFNNQGIVSLCFDPSQLPHWETLREKRLTQGWPLEIWSPEELRDRCPQVDFPPAAINGISRELQAAIYSPADAQVHPAKLTQALVAAAASRGVTFYDNLAVTKLKIAGQSCVGVQTTRRDFDADWVVLSAGLGSAALTEVTGLEPLVLMPVLGQAVEIQLPEVLGHQDFQPVINGEDIHFVPLGGGRYWLGATVEFPAGEESAVKDLASMRLRIEDLGSWQGSALELTDLRQGMAEFVGAVTQATVIKTWRGLRPRPVGQPAPVIKPLGEIKNVTLATGHYRNGVLLAPATAQMVCELLKDRLSLERESGA